MEKFKVNLMARNQSYKAHFAEFSWRWKVKVEKAFYFNDQRNHLVKPRGVGRWRPMWESEWLYGRTRIECGSLIFFSIVRFLSLVLFFSFKKGFHIGARSRPHYFPDRITAAAAAAAGVVSPPDNMAKPPIFQSQRKCGCKQQDNKQKIEIFFSFFVRTNASITPKKSATSAPFQLPHSNFP